MAELVKLCKTDDVKAGEALQTNPEGMPSLAVYVIDGEYYVTENMCTHGMAWLTDGYVEDGELAVKVPRSGRGSALVVAQPLQGYNFGMRIDLVEALLKEKDE